MPTAVPAEALSADITPVTAPSGLSRDASVTNGVKINFTDNSKSELRYDLQRRQGAGDWATVAVGNINDDSITDFHFILVNAGSNGLDDSHWLMPHDVARLHEGDESVNQV